MNPSDTVNAHLDRGGGAGSGAGFLKQGWTRPPQAELTEDGKGIRWWYSAAQRTPRPEYQGALGRFVALRSPSDFVRFVRKYGKLDLCNDHQMPWTHNPPPNDEISQWILHSTKYAAAGESQVKLPSLYGCIPEDLPAEGEEPVQAWRKYVGQFGAILRLAQNVRMAAEGLDISRDFGWLWICNPQLISDDLHDALVRIELLEPGHHHPERDARFLAEFRAYVKDELEIGSQLIPDDLNDARLRIHSFVNDQLEIGRVRPRVEWDEDQSKSVFGFEPGDMGLYGALALQLAMAVAQAGGTYTCTGCGIPYPRKARRPKPGQANYCDACGRRASKRDAARRRRDKQRKAKEA